MNQFYGFFEVLGDSQWSYNFLGDVLRAIMLECSIIAMPEDAKYRLQDMLTMIAYAARSTNNSPEMAATELRQKNPRLLFHPRIPYSTMAKS